MKHAIRLSLLAAAFATTMLHAAPIKGAWQIEEDWQMGCDNTGTCLIAGYSELGSDKPVSVLFTRAAGENTPIEGDAYLISEKELSSAKLLIDGKSHGQVTLDKNSGYGKLSDSQTQALLTAVKRGQSVTFQHQNETWTLSNKGATVTLLYADKFQQREGTPSAFIHIGNEKKTVLTAAPKPVITVPPVLPAKPVIIKYGSKGYKNLLAQLLAVRNAASPKDEQSHTYDCADVDDEKEDMVLYPIDKDNALLSVFCGRGAYQGMDDYFLTDGKGKTVKKYIGLLGNMGDGYENGLLNVGLKGRGLGDCLSTETYAWNGTEFVLAVEKDTGLCRGFPGGAWDFYSITSEIRHAK